MFDQIMEATGINAALQEWVDEEFVKIVAHFTDLDRLAGQIEALYE
jgi:hypothetical protein